MSAALDPLDALITVTRFTTASATFKSEKAMCLRDLAEVIVTSQAPEKEALLWLKLARFGSRATDRGSLRHNANVVEITGIEGDYDGEVMPIDEAEARLREVDVAALIYTSPSHTDAKPRWRVLAPLSKGYPPADRKRFLARLNGVLGGILSGESFTLSQSYYYGSIAGKPVPRLAWVEGGEFIDLLDDLDATAIGKKKADDKPKTNGNIPHNEAPRSHTTSADEAQRRYARAACDAEMDNLASTSKYRGTALARSAFVLGTLVGAGALSESDAVAALHDAIRRNGLDEKDGWARVNACIDRQIKAGMAKPRDLRDVGTRSAGRGASPPHPGFDEEPDEQPHHGPEREAKWSEPLDLIGAPELVGWPELTTDCLPAPLYRYVMAEADRLNVDPCALAGHVLAACAASISDAWSIKPKRHDPWTQHARLWVCIVKDVGVRGTDTIRSAFWPVYERDREAFKRWQKEYAEWKTRQKQKGRDSGDDDEDPEPHLQRIVTNDANVEALSEILKDAGDYGKVTYHTDELAAFFGSFNRYTTSGGGARAAMLEAFDGGPQHIDRIKRGHVFVPNWSVNNAGNIQPRKLAAMAKDLIDDGLFQRFLKLHQRPPTPGRTDDRPITASIGCDYRELHTALADLRPDMSNPTPVYVEDEGYDIRQKLMRLIERLQFDPSLPTIIRETAPKWSGLHARLSLIFHLVDIAERVRSGEILTIRERCCVTGDTVAMAAAFLRRVALPNLFRLGYETMPEEGCPAHARWIAGYILAHSTTTITGREIGRAYRMVRGKDKDISEAMAVLVHAAWAVPQAARYDSSAWTINPAVHTIFGAAAEAERQRRAAVVEIIKTKISDL